MKSLAILSFLVFTVSSIHAKDYYITVGSDAVDHSQQSLIAPSLKVISSNKQGVSLVKINEKDLNNLHEMMHEEMNRCAGFKRFDSLDEAKEELKGEAQSQGFVNMIFADYSINQQNLVRDLLPQIDPINILHTIEKMSSFKNRFYTSPYGVKSQAWLKATWEKLVASRSDAKVEYFQHSRWKQPSVILTIKGKSDDVIVVGGHADSIAGFWGRNEARAPGADDNASGIATITEIIRVLVQNNYVPNKTLKFMGYAAEEVGLLGSRDIARSFREKNINVVGVMQFDMTNFNGSNLDIVMMNDYTNQAQNTFVGNLIDTYLPGISWGYDHCGYACSDHASWTAAGYPASIPFEATFQGMNHNIHTSRDTLAQSRNSTQHAQKFAKLGLAYVVELDR